MRISRRTFLRTVGSGLVFAAVSPVLGVGERKKSRPNVLWIMFDDCRADALGCYGKPWAKTPNMDRIAANGVRFEDAIIQSVVCVPSRSVMMTGFYPHTLGVTAMGDPPAVTPGYMSKARSHPPALIDSFARVGIKPVNVGKLHAYGKAWDLRGDVHPHFHATGQPRDEKTRQIMKESSSDYPHAVTKTHKWVIGGTIPLEPEQMSTSQLGNSAVETLDELAGAEEPFFLRVSFHAPHVPCRIPKSKMIDPDSIDLPLPDEKELNSKPSFERNNLRIYGEADLTSEQIKLSRATYYSMVSMVDEQVGKLLETLAKHGKVDNTIIAINSDQGFQLGEHGLWKKRVFYEQNVKTPFILSCPELLPKGKVIEEPVELIDFVPTLMDLADLDIPDGIDGRTMMPLITGKVKQWKEACFAEHDYSGDMYDELRRDGGRCVMVRTKQWKLVYFKDSRVENINGSLYNLKEDPGEKYNLFGKPEYELVTGYLRGLADKWDSKT